MSLFFLGGGVAGRAAQPAAMESKREAREGDGQACSGKGRAPEDDTERPGPGRTGSLGAPAPPELYVFHLNR